MRITSRLAPVLPVLLSLVLGLAWHLLIAAPVPKSDALLYHQIGATVAGVAESSSWRDAMEAMAARGWLHSLLIAATYAVVGAPDAATFAALQAVILLPATTALTYVAGRFAFDRMTGLAAAWGVALWFPLVYHTTWLLPETTVGLVATTALALLALVVNQKHAKFAVGLGVALGVAALTHPAWQFLALALLAALAVHFAVYDRPRIRLVGWAGAGMLLVLGPYAFVASGVDLPRPGESSGYGAGGGGGWGFWVGSRSSTGFQPIADDYKVAELNARGDVRRIAHLIRAGKLETDTHLPDIVFARASRGGSAARRITDGDFYRAGLQNLLDDPRAWPEKLELGVTTVFLPSRDLVVVPLSPALYDPPFEATWFRRPWRPLALFVFSLMVAGVVLVLTRHRERLVMVAPLVAQTAVFVSGSPESRYGYPLLSSVFVLAAFGSLGFMCAMREARSRQSRPRDSRFPSSRRS